MLTKERTFCTGQPIILKAFTATTRFRAREISQHMLRNISCADSRRKYSIVTLLQQGRQARLASPKSGSSIFTMSSDTMQRIEFPKLLEHLRRPLLATLFIATLAGCEVELPLQSCTAGTLSRMYLGQDTPTGAVTPAQWERFVTEVVTPQFPGGFTVIDATGQWRDKDGSIKHEDTRVLEIVHDGSPQRQARVRALAHAYKRTFAQQSVLLSQMPTLQCS
jgi:Protein of unknown function (DUF3574)